MKKRALNAKTTAEAITEIKQAYDANNSVYWSHDGYEVQKWNDRYYVVCTDNNHTIGLTNLDGDKLNGKIEDFYIIEW